ncbi:hypothetical protein EG329_010595 [Mollisiaceae sp. DMI_Dod_QoI]|nr:hypothetical protein EG329_010595 [Helotiales sp. DMI_Dod_QoI]
MERHGRRGGAAGEQSRHRDSREHPSSSRHHRSHKSPHEPLRTNKEDWKTESYRDSTHAKLPKEMVAMPLNGDDDYVRRWLAHTDSLTNHDLDRARKRETNYSEYWLPLFLLSQKRAPADGRQEQEHEEKSHTAHVKPNHHRFDPQESEEALAPIRKRKRHSSSDSSILAEPIRPKSQQFDRGKKDTSTRKRQEESVEGHCRKQRIESSESSSSDPFTSESPPKETFEKRARHKTREDKYEPKAGDKKTKKNGAEQKPRRKREKKKSECGKTAKKSGEDLMHNFSSKSIGQDRLTIRPPQGLGLFNNGRASSPARRRGLPDLAFSEMDFLQRPNRQAQVDHGVQVRSKSREKEKRKASRAQEEITEFFRPSRKTLEEIHPNKNRRASSATKAGKRSIYVEQVEQENRQSRDDIRSLDSRDRPYIGLRQSDQSSGRLSTRDSLAPVITHRRKYHESTSKASEKATSYVSWSDTQLSPSAASRRQTTIDGRRFSPAPESVRKSLENTGIFRNTGIERISEVVHRPERPSSRKEESKATHRPEAAHYSERRTSNTPNRASADLESTDHLLDARYHDKRPASPVRSRSPIKDTSHQFPNKIASAEDDNIFPEAGKVRERLVVEQFHPELGWYETPDLVGRSASTAVDLPQEPKNTLVDRQQLAKIARIKRPSTALPISRVSVEQKEQENYPENINQVADSTPRVERNEHKTSTLVDDTVLPTEMKGATDKIQYTNTAQGVEQENMPHTVPEQGEDTFVSDPRDSMQGEKEESQLGLQESQQNMEVDTLQEKDFNQTAGTSTYLGLPLRGSWHPQQNSHSRQLTPMSDKQPHFLRQMQQEALRHHDTILGYGEVTNYGAYDMPEDETAPYRENYEGYSTHEGFVEEHVMHDHYDQNPNEQMDIDSFEHSNIDTLPMEYHQSYNAYEESELYDPPDGYDERQDDHHVTVEDDFIGQELEIPFEAEEQSGYDVYDVEDNSHMEEFWRSHRHY